MARPTHSQLNVSIEDRIEQAFWELLETNAPERISIVALAKQAHCNRGTFYYYFTDIYDLLDKLIAENLPTGVPLHLLAYVSGTAPVDAVRIAMDAEDEKLKKLGFLLMRSESSYCADKLKESAISVWCAGIGVDAESMDKSDYLMFEFVASGLLGMLAYCGKNHVALTGDEIVEALLPEIPQALIARVKRRHKEISADNALV